MSTNGDLQRHKQTVQGRAASVDGWTGKYVIGLRWRRDGHDAGEASWKDEGRTYRKVNVHHMLRSTDVRQNNSASAVVPHFLPCHGFNMFSIYSCRVTKFLLVSGFDLFTGWVLLNYFDTV